MISIDGRAFRKAVRDNKLGEHDDERVYKGNSEPLTAGHLDQFVRAIKAQLSEPFTGARAEELNESSSPYVRVFVMSERELPQEDFTDAPPEIETTEQLHSFVGKADGNVYLPQLDESGPNLVCGARCNVANESSYACALNKKGMMLPFIGGARILLELGVSVDSTNALGETMLMYACSQLSATMISWLLDKGADPRKASLGSGVTALHRLAEAKGSEDLKADFVRKLASKGAQINAVNAWKVTPLHLAALVCDRKTCEALVACGADVKAKDDSGKRPIDVIPSESSALDAKDSITALRQLLA